MKKRTLSLLLALVMVFGLLPMTARAGELYNGLEYWVYKDHVEITDCDSDVTEVVIPAEIEGLPVTSIGDEAFYQCYDLTSITIPEGVTRIGNGAFERCSSLTSIVIPEGVTSIGNHAFSYSTNLTIIDLPESVTSIGNAAFTGCTSLTSIDLPDGITSIGGGVFESCSSLTSIDIPNGITAINNQTFACCTSLTSIDIPSGVTGIGKFAFYECTKLVSIYFNGDAPEFGSDVFIGVTATAYYPVDNSTWNVDAMQDIGSEITWVPYDPNHTHKYEATVTAPTCTEQGYTTYTCICKYSYVADHVDALGHDSVVTVVCPTCTEDGYTLTTCSRCDLNERSNETEATGHSHNAVVTAPTCMEKGYTTHTCTVCGDSYVDTYVDAPGHDLVMTVVLPTCTNDGYNLINCTRCDYYERYTTEATGHSYTTVVTAPTCTKRGFTTYTCTTCGASHTGNYTLFLGHTYRSGTCTRCGEVDPDYENPEWNPFTDVQKGSFYYEPVMWAVEYGITSGTSYTTFSPDDRCLRSQVVTFLHRAAENPEPTSSRNPFKDVKPGDYFYNPVLWAVEKGITDGVADNLFGSNDICTRGQVVTFLWRAAGKPDPTSTTNPFTDVKSGDYFYNPVLWALENGITDGVTETSFAPNATCTRAQVVTFLHRSNN